MTQNMDQLPYAPRYEQPELNSMTIAQLKIIRDAWGITTRCRYKRDHVKSIHEHPNNVDPAWLQRFYDTNVLLPTYSKDELKHHTLRELITIGLAWQIDEAGIIPEQIDRDQLITEILRHVNNTWNSREQGYQRHYVGLALVFQSL